MAGLGSGIGSFNSGSSPGYNSSGVGQSSGGGYGGSTSNPGGGYYNPNSNYGYQGQLGAHPETNSVIGGPTGYLEQNHDYAFTKYLGDIGASESATNGGYAYGSPYQQWLRAQQNQTETGYGAAYAKSPFMTYQQYLSGLGGNDFWSQQYNQLAPSERGIDYSRFAPRTAWIPR